MSSFLIINKRKFFLIVLIVLSISKFNFSNEIVRDRQGNYFLIKKNGTYLKIPPPKPGYKYQLKKKEVSPKDRSKFIERPKKNRDTRSARQQNQKGNR